MANDIFIVAAYEERIKRLPETLLKIKELLKLYKFELNIPWLNVTQEDFDLEWDD